MTERFAIYYAPATSHALWERAAAWLGRDAADGSVFDGPVAGLDRDRLLNATQSASRYGFHATLKAPMALQQGHTAPMLTAALAEFATANARVPLGRLQLAWLDGFLALVIAGDDEPVRDFCAKVVEGFEAFRAPMTLRDRQARRSKGLTPRQEEMLDAYGYPYVFEEFFFHMTLTDRLAPSDQPAIMAAAKIWFAQLLQTPFWLDRVCLFYEADSGLPFMRVADFQLQDDN